MLWCDATFLLIAMRYLSADIPDMCYFAHASIAFEVLPGCQLPPPGNSANYSVYGTSSKSCAPLCVQIQLAVPLAFSDEEPKWLEQSSSVVQLQHIYTMSIRARSGLCNHRLQRIGRPPDNGKHCNDLLYRQHWMIVL